MVRMGVSIVVGVAVMAAGYAHAEKIERGVVVNESTKECARYWSGDECTKVTIPQGWSPIAAAWDEKRGASVLRFKDRECVWKAKNEAECCKAFELTFLPDMKLKTEKSGLEKDRNSPCYQLPVESSVPAPAMP